MSPMTVSAKLPPLPAGDLSGDYIVWLDSSCPVHSAVVAGVDIPKFIDVIDHVCPRCNRRFVPDEVPARCVDCQSLGHTVIAVPDRTAAPRRMKRRLTLSDQQLREIHAKLDPERKIERDATGRRLDGPRMVPTPQGETLLAPFVKWMRVDDVLNEPESVEMALQRRLNLRRLARIAERLATAQPGDLTVAQREKYAARIAQLTTTLGIPADPADESETTPVKP